MFGLLSAIVWVTAMAFEEVQVARKVLAANLEQLLKMALVAEAAKV
jgi:hypothetical protein